MQECQTFKEKTIKERFALARQLRLCFGCLKRGHMTKSCYHKRPCADCNGKHATLLHPPTPAVEEDAEQEIKNEASCRLVNSKSKLSGFTGAGGKVTVLPVVPVKVRMKNGTSCIERNALLDSGSNATFCTEYLVRRLAAETV